MKFFISYSRSVKAQTGAVIDLLRAAGHEVWWDGDIPASADWWATILHHLEQAQVVIFMVSEKAVQSPYCMAELRYAIARNRPVLPFIMDDHTRYTIPPEFGRRQWFVYHDDAAAMLRQIVQDCDQIIWEQYRDRHSPRPPEPNSGNSSLTKQFQQAVGLAEEGRFAESSAAFQNVASLDYAEWGEECQRWMERLNRYAEIAELADHKATLTRARRKWDDLRTADPEAASFDPLLVLPRLSSAAPLVVAQPAASVVTAPVPSAISAGTRQSSLELLPQPFAWMPIPAGRVTVESGGYLDQADSFAVGAFEIGKYPVTNAQYDSFITAGGYGQPRWWTAAGWAQREKENWAEPRCWNETMFNGREQPVTGISWYEAVAFCAWLSETTGERIQLPTEQQWQRAAQGDTPRDYPWGNKWDTSRMNHNFEGRGTGRTTPVRKYEGRGDSPYGVVDMSGNVWEWCLTAYDTGSTDVNGTDVRTLRGGSWYFKTSILFRCDHRGRSVPHDGFNNRGFRLARV
jgi:formylglycine-generating enzyme required for sulfatase activity